MDAYAASAICSPTRASILTGKYSRPEIGITRATPQQSLPLKEITMEILKERGMPPLTSASGTCTLIRIKRKSLSGSTGLRP